MGEEALARLKARPDRYAEVTGRLERHSVASLLALLDETYARTDWLADCARIRCPALIIAGAEDQFPTVEMSARVAAVDSRRPFSRRGGRSPLPESKPSRRGAVGDRRFFRGNCVRVAEYS